ncbi:hypothetical protein HID58_005460 [Brassica napus]|uniref:Uncharacterized protein n=1 Tax=Brassica napus TaxID=3708 RepID=A0ABQ8E8L8_BRANA|nr:hypothetical protein HID58_005460 [Brassica napus]
MNTGFRTLLNELTIRYQIKIYTRRFDQHARISSGCAL